MSDSRNGKKWANSRVQRTEIWWFTGCWEISIREVLRLEMWVLFTEKRRLEDRDR